MVFDFVLNFGFLLMGVLQAVSIEAKVFLFITLTHPLLTGCWSGSILMRSPNIWAKQHKRAVMNYSLFSV